MKKLLVLLLIVTSMVSCKHTSSKQDTAYLQKTYPVVYSLNAIRYVVVDSAGVVYDLGVTQGGAIDYKIKIK